MRIIIRVNRVIMKLPDRARSKRSKEMNIEHVEDGVGERDVDHIGCGVWDERCEIKRVLSNQKLVYIDFSPLFRGGQRRRALPLHTNANAWFNVY